MYEARTRLAELVEKASRGEEVVITKHGHPMARLVPAADPAGRPISEIVDALGAAKIRLEPGESIEQWIEEGRR